MALPGGGTYYADPPITFRVTWTMSAVDDTNYYVAVSVNLGAGYSLVGTTTTGATQMDYQHTDYVQNGGYNTSTPTFTFKVEVVRRSDSVVVSTSTASGLPVTIGTCSADV